MRRCTFLLSPGAEMPHLLPWKEALTLLKCTAMHMHRDFELSKPRRLFPLRIGEPVASSRRAPRHFSTSLLDRMVVVQSRAGQSWSSWGAMSVFPLPLGCLMLVSWSTASWGARAGGEAEEKGGPALWQRSCRKKEQQVADSCWSVVIRVGPASVMLVF